MSDTLQLVVVVPNTQLQTNPRIRFHNRCAIRRSGSCRTPAMLSVINDYDKLKRIGHLARVPLKLSVQHDDDKLKRIGHLARVPASLSAINDYDKLKRIGHLVRVPIDVECD